MVALTIILLSGCNQTRGLNFDSLTATAGGSPVAQVPTDSTAPTQPATAPNPSDPTATTEPIDQPTQPEVPTDVPVIDEPPTQILNTPVPTLLVTPPPTGEQAWIALKTKYQRFDPPVQYSAPGLVMLWWYDPMRAQFVQLGYIDSPITAQAQYTLRGQWSPVLEVSYSINQSYALVLDASLLSQIRQAGYPGDTIETFVYLAPDMSLAP